MTTKEEYAQIYANAAHAMQSGVLTELGLDNPHLNDNELDMLKDLRVGINSAHVSQQALATMLIRQGIISELDYHKAQAEAMLEEQRRLEAALSKRLNKPIKLM